MTDSTATEQVGFVHSNHISEWP